MNSFELARRELGLSLQAVGDKAGCHLGTVANAEGTDPLSVRTKTAFSIARALTGSDDARALELMARWIAETTALRGLVVSVRIVEGEPELKWLKRLRG